MGESDIEDMTEVRGGVGGTSAALDLHGEQSRREVESSLLTIPGVNAVRLVPGFDRPVDELHIVTGPDRSAKQTVRDVQSFLYATFGLSIDHRVVSVVQIEDGAEGTAEPGTRRAVMTELSTTSRGEVFEATVRLRSEGRVLEGSASSSVSAVGRRRAVAQATLTAAQGLLDERHSVDIEGVQLTEIGSEIVAVSLVQLHGTRRGRSAAGSAVVTSDELTAVARSVLDALNRHIGSTGPGQARSG